MIKAATLTNQPMALPPSPKARRANRAAVQGDGIEDSAAEWIETMRALKDRLPSNLSWANKLDALVEATRDWLRYMKPWVKEIGVHTIEDRKVYVHVVLKSPDAVTLRNLRLVAELEIILGAVFAIPITARKTPELSDNYTLVITHADNNPAR